MILSKTMYSEVICEPSSRLSRAPLRRLLPTTPLQATRYALPTRRRLPTLPLTLHASETFSTCLSGFMCPTPPRTEPRLLWRCLLACFLLKLLALFSHKKSYLQPHNMLLPIPDLNIWWQIIERNAVLHQRDISRSFKFGGQNKLHNIAVITIIICDLSTNAKYLSNVKSHFTV